MDGNSGSDPNSPLLRKDGRSPGASGGGGRRGRYSRRNSFNSLRTEFVAKLPDKVRAGIESESFDIDFSRTSGLSKGLILPILHFFTLSV